MVEDEKDRELEENPPAQPEVEFEEYPAQAEELTWGDRLLVERQELSPRHRKFAELAAQGKKPGEIAQELGYSSSRVSVLLSNTHIKNEIEKIRERIYQETIGKRLREMAEPALGVAEMILTDRTNKVKVSEKADMAKWVLEKLDGKAIQKHDLGENMLGLLMDKLDSLKSAGAQVGGYRPQPEAIDVTPQEVREIEPPKPKDEEGILREWVDDFTK